MMKSVEELSSIGTSFSGSLVWHLVSAGRHSYLWFGLCVRALPLVCTLSVGDETVTGMLGVALTGSVWCETVTLVGCFQFGGLLDLVGFFCL